MNKRQPSTFTKISRAYSKILRDLGEAPPVKMPRLEQKDRDEFKRLCDNMKLMLQDAGDYQPAIDDLLIERAVTAFIYARKFHEHLDATAATEAETIARIADAISKFDAAFRNALRELAANRRERLKFKTQAEVEGELKEFFEQLEAAGKVHKAYG